jgi:hypothetical protein
MLEKYTVFQRYIIEGLIVGSIVYLIGGNQLRLSEILLISLTSMLLLVIFDRIRNIEPEPFINSYSTKNFIPPGGMRTEILPLTTKNPQALSIAECQKINSYLMANPIERVNNRLKDVFIQCKEKIAKHVKFNNRVQTVSPTGSLDSESLLDSLCDS